MNRLPCIPSLSVVKARTTDEPLFFLQLIVARLERHASDDACVDIGGRFRSYQVVVTIISAESHQSGAPPGECLCVAVGRVQVAMAVTQTDTSGRLTSPERQTWDHLLNLARPQILMAIRTCRVPPADFDDCVQEAWLEVISRIHRVTADPARGNLAGWVQTVARRAAWRFLRREIRGQTVELLPELIEEISVDSEQLDPAEACCQQELSDTLSGLIDELPHAVSHEAHLLIDRCLSHDKPKLNALAEELDLTPGQLWHQWRKGIRFLRKHLKQES